MRRWTSIAVVLVVALAAAAAALAVRARDEDDDRPSVTGWDRRVVELAAFVEDERGLRFDHPVRTEFLSEAEFRKEVTDDVELTAEDADELRHLEGIFRALGLVSGKLDLVAATNTLKGEEIIGLYDPEADRILIRGDRITIGMRPTIVHELTHALQAQHHDLERDHDRSGAEIAFTSLVEADAMRIEERYVASLSAEDQRAVEQARVAQIDEIDLEGVPDILSELFSLPYVLGPPFLEALLDDGGDDAVERAFRSPPVSEEQVVDPSAYLTVEVPAKVPTPKLRKSERRVGEADDFGMVSLLLVLGERIPFAQAWAAVDGWSGDASIGYRADGSDCIRIRVALDTPEDAEELLVATRQWAAGRTGSSVTRSGRTVDLDSCDPGLEADAAAAPPDRPRTFELLQLRLELIKSLVASGADEPIATCVADTVLREHDPAQLLEVAQITDPNDPRLVRLQRDVRDAGVRCG